MAVSSEKNLTEEEMKIYDRQLRIWGLEKQKRMMSSTILFWSLDGCNSEILKNVVLAGTGGCVLVEEGIVTKTNVESHFYLAISDIGKPWAEVALEYFQTMNPNVKMTIKTKEEIQLNENGLSEYALVFVANQNLAFQIEISNACHDLKIPYFYSRSCGMYALAFCDCIKFEFTKKITKDDKKVSKHTIRHYNRFETATKTQLKVKKRFKGIPRVYLAIQALEELENENREFDMEFVKEKITKMAGEKYVDEKVIQDIQRTFGLNIAMTNAMLGGYIANAGLAILQRDEKHPPFYNTLCLDWSINTCWNFISGQKNVEISEAFLEQDDGISI